MPTGTLVAITLYFALMLGIGLQARRQHGASLAGYLLGGRQLGPAVTALSAGASDMSAWIMMGLPGAMVLSGFSSAWIALGLFLGAWANYRLVAPRLRTLTERLGNALTLPDYFETRFGDDSHVLRRLAAVVIILFFALYTSSGLVAGGVLFESSFGLSYQFGLWLTAAVVVAYTFVGGFRAVCVTDFVQGTIMLLALLVVPLVALTDLGGVDVLVTLVEPEHFDWLQGLGVAALLSNLAWGLGYFGQPHIVVRFMAIRSVRELPAARRIGLGWMLLSLLGSLATGLVGLAWTRHQGLELDDPETVFIVLGKLLFHPFVAGVLLAAILAAIMSTISSQLLVAASSLSGDLYRSLARQAPTEQRLLQLSRMAVIVVALCAALLASSRSSSILALVSHAWAGFGAAFGPLLSVSLFWNGMNAKGALAGMLVGAVVVLVWIYAPLFAGGATGSSLLYEMIPGCVCSTLAIIVVSRVTGGATRPVRSAFVTALDAKDNNVS